MILLFFLIAVILRGLRSFELLILVYLPYPPTPVSFAMKLDYQYFQDTYAGVLTPAEHLFEVEQLLGSEVYSIDNMSSTSPPVCCEKVFGLEG